MNFSEELAMAGELELTDSELETVSGGHRGWGRDYDDFEPYWYRPVPWWYYRGWGGDFGGGWDEGRGGGWDEGRGGGWDEGRRREGRR